MQDGLWNFASWRSSFCSQMSISQRAPCDFAAAKLAFNLVWLASNGYNFFISTPICVLFKAWIPDFLSFQTTYSMHEMDSRKCSKYVQQLLSSWILHVRFLSLISLLAFMICFWQRTTELQSLGSSYEWASNCFTMDSIELSSILDCFGDKKAIKNTKTCHNLIRNTCKGP